MLTMRRNFGAVTLAVLAVATAGLAGQTPQPFPRPASSSTPERAAPQAPPVAKPPTTATAPQVAVPVADPPATATGNLGVPMYPTAQFLASYDAGRGQRYYIYGTTAAYLEIVAFYKSQLGKGGDQVFREPTLTHVFEVGRYREETMAFPPGVTIKDWTGGGSQGYPNPKAGAEPARFPTIIMVATAPPPAPPQR
jgi:hypothetical protein